MPRYFYDVNNGHEVRDNEGLVASGPEEARTHAMQIVSDYMQGTDRMTADGDAVVVDVRDTAGNHIVTARLVLNVEIR